VTIPRQIMFRRSVGIVVQQQVVNPLEIFNSVVM